MVEVRTYEGDAAGLAALCAEVWQGEFSGKETMPVWDERFLDWGLLAERPGGRDYLLAAYDGAKLVGAFLAEPFRFRVQRGGAESEVEASTGSWLSVLPDHRAFGAGLALVETMRERHLERGARFCLGFIVGGEKVGAYRFWSAYARAFPEAVQQLGALGGWFRVFDPRAIADWSFSPAEQRAVRVVGAFARRPSAPEEGEDGVRAYAPADLPACLALTRGLLEGVDLGYVWPRERLDHQLRYRDLPRTLVVERGGRVVGMLNWYPMGALGRLRRVEMAMIDLLCTAGLSGRERRTLLRRASADMVAAGCAAAYTLRLPCCPAPALLAAGYVPLPADNHVIGLMADPGFSLAGLRRLHVHLR